MTASTGEQWKKILDDCKLCDTDGGLLGARELVQRPKKRRTSFISLDGKRRCPLASPPNFLQGTKIIKFVSTRPRMSQNMSAEACDAMHLAHVAIDCDVA